MHSEKKSYYTHSHMADDMSKEGVTKSTLCYFSIYCPSGSNVAMINTIMIN
uniref:Uncharacterized protein n=1 Tax=Anguilla anguilla TaxID=7936 RepID=A0A0E9SC99_ANGAN